MKVGPKMGSYDVSRFSKPALQNNRAVKLLSNSDIMKCHAYKRYGSQRKERGVAWRSLAALLLNN